MRLRAASAAVFFWTQASLCALAGMGLPGTTEVASSCAHARHDDHATPGNHPEEESHPLAPSAPGPGTEGACDAHCDSIERALLGAAPAAPPPATRPARLAPASLDAALPIRAVSAAWALRLPPRLADRLLENASLRI